VPPVQSALSGRTIVMSGGSRGMGLAILIAAARHGANAVLLAKTGKPRPRLPGTVHTAAEQMAAAGLRDRSRYGGRETPALDLCIDPPEAVLPEEGTPT